MKRVHEVEENNEQSNENMEQKGESSSAPKKKKRRSYVWNHFTINLAEDGETEFAHCNYCQK